MVCKHLREIEAALIAAGIAETFRGKAWSLNCREWVYFDCSLDRKSLRRRLTIPECVHDHDHRGTHDGQEAGFVCVQCQDGVMGVHQAFRKGYRTFG